MKVIVACVMLVLLCSSALADVYMHNPRGSNDRLNERPNNRNNANRLFDSQNNNRGGYNQGYMYYYEGSVLEFEWTNQHACGSNPNDDCEIIIQYMCEDTAGEGVRDGQTTNTIQVDQVDPEDYTRGRQENHDYYAACATRERNKGLFTADQNLRGNSARFTRQNPRGNRYGLECAEERDYYPYWAPSPWKDIAVLTNNVSRCDYYLARSENVVGRGYCTDPKQNNKDSCLAVENAEWLDAGAHNIPPPECKMNPFGRDNHHGNTLNTGEMARYTWVIPKNATGETCVTRMRYNISTGDRDMWDSTVNSNYNGKQTVDGQRKGKLPLADGQFLTNNDIVEFGLNQDLDLATNTAQFGRTFQDRSHVFSLRQRPAELDADVPIYNLNVRGKRGNIVQTYPAVEYDFIPADLIVQENEFVHFQWTGSNSNDNNNDGQGQRGTDRSNIVQIDTRNKNYPGQLDNHTLWDRNMSNWAGVVKEFATLSQNDDELDDAAPYFDGGVISMKATGIHHYMCSRNNNFTNRSQKGSLQVDPLVPGEESLPIALIAGAVVGLALVSSAIGVAAPVVATKTGATSKIVSLATLVKAKFAGRIVSQAASTGARI